MAAFAASLPPPLDPKVMPSRTIGVTTFEALLATAGELLGEVGFEGLSTNLICKRAGMTPPALYRYFPNKYAVLSELGRRLMLAQDEAVFAWMEEGGLEAEAPAEAVERCRRLLLRLVEITQAQPGGVWILRALRAAPALHEVRTASRDLVARRLAAALRQRYPVLSEARLLSATRLTTDVMSSATEMILEDPDRVDEVIDEVCWMVALYFAQLPERRPGQGAPRPG